MGHCSLISIAFSQHAQYFSYPQQHLEATSPCNRHLICIDMLFIAAVGQFKDIVEVAEKDPQLCETLKKVLKLTRGWEIARDHARTAVTSDNRMRVWCPQGSSKGLPPQSGLLFKCNLGSVDLENPVGEQAYILALLEATAA